MNRSAVPDTRWLEARRKEAADRGVALREALLARYMEDAASKPGPSSRM